MLIYWDRVGATIIIRLCTCSYNIDNRTQLHTVYKLYKLYIHLYVYLCIYLYLQLYTYTQLLSFCTVYSVHLLNAHIMSAIVYSSTDNYIYTYTVIHNYHALWPITLALYNVDKHNVHCAHTIIIFFQEPTLLFIKTCPHLLANLDKIHISLPSCIS